MFVDYYEYNGDSDYSYEYTEYYSDDGDLFRYVIISEAIPIQIRS